MDSELSNKEIAKSVAIIRVLAEKLKSDNPTSTPAWDVNRFKSEYQRAMNRLNQ